MSKTAANEIEQQALVAVFHTHQLKGRLQKILEVPAGHKGISIVRNRNIKNYPPGKHYVLSGLQRILGDGAGLLAGYYPQTPFPCRLSVNNLLAGDNTLVDMSLMGEVTVDNPERLIIYAAKQPEASNPSYFELDSNLFYDCIYQIVQQYAAEDLVDGSLSVSLTGKLFMCLNQNLSQAGLQLSAINNAFFWLSENRLDVAEKILELHTKRQEFAQKMAEAQVQNPEQIKSVLQHIDPELVSLLGVHGVPDKTNTDRLLTWFKAQSQPDGSEKFGYLTSKFSKKEKEEKKQETIRKRYPRNWRLPYLLWIAFFIVSGLAVTFLIKLIGGDSRPADQWAFYLGNWAMVIGFVFDRVRAMIVRSEQISASAYSEEGVTLLDDLGQNNRKRIDQLVREQAALELDTMYRIWSDIRSRVYHAGGEDLALKIKQLEFKLEEGKTLIMDPSKGQAPYTSDLKITKVIWYQLLDKDEKFLIEAAAVSNEAVKIQAKHPDYSSLEADINGFTNQLDQLLFSFTTRGRALHN